MLATQTHLVDQKVTLDKAAPLLPVLRSAIAPQSHTKDGGRLSSPSPPLQSNRAQLPCSSSPVYSSTDHPLQTRAACQVGAGIPPLPSQAPLDPSASQDTASQRPSARHGHHSGSQLSRWANWSSVSQPLSSACQRRRSFSGRDAGLERCRTSDDTIPQRTLSWFRQAKW